MIEEARSKCSFDIDDMSLVIYTKEFLNKWIKVQEIIAKDPILQNNVEEYGYGREKLYEIYCKKAYRIHKLLNYSDDGIATLINCMFPQTIVSFLHQSMFIPTIKNLASEKQVDKWLPLCLNYQMIGCYAQTELGHGSDVQSLETTATYDKQTDQFIMNSPTLTSTKWWIGDLGFTANHCVAQAQLFIDGKNYGVQTFLVQLRDIETHLPLPGILLGDVGAKYGYNTKDNGYLRFNNFRIPRDNMLMRFAKVNKNGEFVQSQNEKIGYATMMAIRQIIIQNSALSLTQGLAIAIPYSFFRKQFKDAKGHEQYIIDYQTQQDKLIPLVADGFAQHFGAIKIKELLNENIRRVYEKMDFSMMGDLHALLSCCKAVYSWNTHFGLDKIRQSCGGHGYLQSSGIVTIQTEFAPSCTYEGENTVLLLQTARYLIKSLSKAMKKQDINQNVEYLYNITDTLQQNCKLERLSQLMCPETVRRILRQNAAFKVFKAASHLQTKAGEVGPKEAWNSHCGILLTEASIAHTHYWTIKNFLDVLMKYADENIKQVLSNLCCLYGIQRIIDHPQGYFESKFMNGEQLRIVLDAKERLFEILKPDLIGLMDSFKFHPNTLRSDLIAKNPYESLLNSARKSQVNNDQEFQIQLNEKLKQLQLNPKL
ncbi:hypothetical protein pb186bvf_016602 [Paramecium bursaria]